MFDMRVLGMERGKGMEAEGCVGIGRGKGMRVEGQSSMGRWGGTVGGNACVGGRAGWDGWKGQGPAWNGRKGSGKVCRELVLICINRRTKILFLPYSNPFWCYFHPQMSFLPCFQLSLALLHRDSDWAECPISVSTSQ